MIVCHQCQQSQPEGAIFCSECGTKLIDTTGLATQSIRLDKRTIEAATTPEPPVSSPIAPPDEKAHVTLLVLKSGDSIPLIGQDDFTIGRMSDGQSIIPDIDLSQFNAYQEGVSRIHASIKVSNNQVSLIDLSSINGTSINEQKIAPNVYQSVEHGDTITLGRLKIQVLIQP